MAKTSFYKYEGLGNDFILISKNPCLTPQQVKNLCDRHLGIGADGLIFVFFSETSPLTPLHQVERGIKSDLPSPLGGEGGTLSVTGEVHMRIFNANGSIAEMCGNGIRCVAQWLHDQGHSVTVIQTDAGPKTCTYESGQWSIDMGIAQITGNRVSMGNPHLVFEGDVQTELIDPSVNTEFVQIKNLHEINIRVFERGVGETEACGTGACASVAILVSQNQLPENEEITVHLKGGNLYITARPTTHGLQIQMKGPARYVFEGEVFVE
ncbi:MAG: diaminopimelate epimerase [Myxococcaceae bacterium]